MSRKANYLVYDELRPRRSACFAPRTSAARPENRHRRQPSQYIHVPRIPKTYNFPLGSRSGAHETVLDKPQPTGGLEVGLMMSDVTLIYFVELFPGWWTTVSHCIPYYRGHGSLCVGLATESGAPCCNKTSIPSAACHHVYQSNHLAYSSTA